MKIHFIVKSNRNTEHECIDLQGKRKNGVYLITNHRLTKFEKESIYNVTIYGHNENEIINEMEGQITDGIFENNEIEVLDIISEK